MVLIALLTLLGIGLAAVVSAPFWFGRDRAYRERMAWLDRSIRELEARNVATSHGDYSTRYTDAPSSTWHVYRRVGPYRELVDIGYVQPRRHLWEDDKDWQAWTPKGHIVAGPFGSRGEATDALIASDLTRERA